MILKTFYLQPMHDGRQSFYQKAVVEVRIDRAILYSYGTRVAEFIHIEEGLDKFIIYGTYSDTTRRHIREFALQCKVGYLPIGEMWEIMDEKGVYL